MDTSPYKRRKTSPISSVIVERQHLRRRPASQDGEQGIGPRASFMSPTKPGLARFNPGLLSPSRYPDNWKNVGTNGHGLIKSQASISDDTNGQVQGSPGAPGFFADLATQAIALEAHGHVSFAASSSPTTRRRNHGPSKKARLAEVEDTRASPPEEAREGGNEAQYSDHEARTHNGNAVFCSDVIDGNLTAFTPQILSTPTRSGTLAAVSGMGLGEDGEPSLPSTPVHLGLEKPPERPKGLLLSSSSKRTKRKGITSAKSSPLKHQIDTTVRSPTGLCPSTEGLGSRTYIANTPRPPLTKTEVSIARMRESLANLEQQLQQIETFLIQQLLLSDWAHIDGESAKEISKLKKEVSSKGVQVIRVRQELQEAELANGTSANLVVAEPRNMIARGQNLIVDIRLEEPRSSKKPSSISHRLARFLPFSERPPPPDLKPPSSQVVDASLSLKSRILGNGKAPFIVSTSETKLLGVAPGDPILQSQIINIHSESESLTTTLVATVDITSQTVTHCQVLKLSSWAEEELGSWLRGVRQDTSLASIGKAFGSYLITCMERLQCWSDTARDVSHLFVTISNFEGLPLHASDADPGQITVLLRQPECVLTRGSVILRITWRISINEEGHVDSDVSAHPQFPDKWQRADIGAELAKVGEVFDLLMQEKSVPQAISVIAGLMFPS